MGWQGTDELQRGRQGTSARIVAQAAQERAVRAFLANGTTANLEALRVAQKNLDEAR